MANRPLPQTYTFSAAGSYVITYTFTDNATPANVTTITQAITVTNSPLYFNPGCPPNISVAADPVTCQWISRSWTPPVGFDCTTGTTTGVTTYGTRNSGDVFHYSETVVYTAFKGANTIQCFFTVTVTDATAPTSVVWTPSSHRRPSHYHGPRRLRRDNDLDGAELYCRRKLQRPGPTQGFVRV